MYLVSRFITLPDVIGNETLRIPLAIPRPDHPWAARVRSEKINLVVVPRKLLRNVNGHLPASSRLLTVVQVPCKVWIASSALSHADKDLRWRSLVLLRRSLSQAPL